MTHHLALWLGGLLLAAIAVDILFFGTEHIVFLGKKFIELIDWVAFWR